MECLATPIMCSNCISMHWVVCILKTLYEVGVAHNEFVVHTEHTQARENAIDVHFLTQMVRGEQH